MALAMPEADTRTPFEKDRDALIESGVALNEDQLLQGAGFRVTGTNKRAPASLSARDGSGKLVLADGAGRITYQAGD